MRWINAIFGIFGFGPPPADVEPATRFVALGMTWEQAIAMAMTWELTLAKASTWEPTITKEMTWE